MLSTDGSRFQPLNPYEAARKMQEESPSIPLAEPEEEHKIDKYMNLMLGPLKQALARLVRLKLQVQDGSLEEGLTEDEAKHGGERSASFRANGSNRSKESSAQWKQPLIACKN